MNSHTSSAYDVFISHSPADREWVDAWLLPQLEQAGLRVCVDYRDFAAGAPRLRNIEAAITGSLRTIAVLTPDWLASEWNAFEDVLVRSLDPAARRRRLIPVKLKPCDLPEALAMLEAIDLTVEKRWEQGVSRLRRNLEDVVTVPAPWRQDTTAPLGARWRRWLRRYRRRVRWAAAGVFVLWLLLFTALGWWPLQPRPVWTAEALEAPYGWVLHNSGVALLVGARNPLEGCDHRHKGLWQRPLANPDAWQDSAVGDLLCIPDRDDLADIRALASLPEQPDSVFALTDYVGVLVSEDGGATFRAYPGGAAPTASGNAPLLLAAAGTAEAPVLWVAAEKAGLFRLAAGEWRRADGPDGCVGLPAELPVTALAATGDRLLIGTNRRGLWISDDGGQQCRQVFDAAGQYQFRRLLPAPGSAHPRYLALVRDYYLEPGDPAGSWQLLDLCPHADACASDRWRSDSTPEWRGSGAVGDVLVQGDGRGGVEWYLANALGQVWRGDLDGAEPTPLPPLRRCLLACTVRLAPSAPGAAPYLLAAQQVTKPLVLAPGRVYTLANGPWWRRLWP